jgi:adenosine deaminase
MVAWFELAAADSRIVSLNLVQPEDDPIAVRDFGLHMSMLDFLHRLYPNVPIALHAGELVNGLVPPAVLRSHIRESITHGHAQRIGHATSVMNEDDPYALLREMADRRILVEVTLSSSDQILGVKGAQHPLKLFLEYGVPVAITTDDMGVARSSHTLEFVKAVDEHDLDYPTIKRIVRNSIVYSFADKTTKARLQSDLERAFVEFERTPR